ncbi:MAG: hypothetical protein RLZ12_832, partial [Bacillota bacterium]
MILYQNIKEVYLMYTILKKYKIILTVSISLSLRFLPVALGSNGSHDVDIETLRKNSTFMQEQEALLNEYNKRLRSSDDEGQPKRRRPAESSSSPLSSSSSPTPSPLNNPTPYPFSDERRRPEGPQPRPWSFALSPSSGPFSSSSSPAQLSDERKGPEGPQPRPWSFVSSVHSINEKSDKLSPSSGPLSPSSSCSAPSPTRSFKTASAYFEHIRDAAEYKEYRTICTDHDNQIKTGNYDFKKLETSKLEKGLKHLLGVFTENKCTELETEVKK